MDYYYSMDISSRAIGIADFCSGPKLRERACMTSCAMTRAFYFVDQSERQMCATFPTVDSIVRMDPHLLARRQYTIGAHYDILRASLTTLREVLTTLCSLLQYS